MGIFYIKVLADSKFEYNEQSDKYEDVYFKFTEAPDNVSESEIINIIAQLVNADPKFIVLISREEYEQNVDEEAEI